MFAIDIKQAPLFERESSLNSMPQRPNSREIEVKVPNSHFTTEPNVPRIPLKKSKRSERYDVKINQTEISLPLSSKEPTEAWHPTHKVKHHVRTKS
jgi:hypothetical protein